MSGRSQSENEQDDAAITALRESVRLAPDNYRAFLTLATSLTNEMQYAEAYAALEAALLHNPVGRSELQACVHTLSLLKYVQHCD